MDKVTDTDFKKVLQRATAMRGLAKAHEATRRKSAARRKLLEGPGEPVLEPVKSLDELERIAMQQLDAQLAHRDPKVRREAIKTALEVTRGRLRDKDGDEITEVRFETVALPYRPPPPAPSLA